MVVRTFIDLEAGRLVVTDDDTNGPVAQLLYVGTNYTFGITNDLSVEDGSLAAGGQITIAYRWYDPSGLFVTNTDLTKTNVLSNNGNVSMNWDLTNTIAQASVNDRIHSPAEIHGRNGDIYVTNVLVNINPIDFSKNADGLWYLTVSAQDHDTDRGAYDPGGSQSGTAVSYDRGITTNQRLAFYVGDDDIVGPTAPAGQIVVMGQDWTNADFSIQWSTSAVTDVSGISGYRVSTNAPSDIFGGTNAGAGTSYVWAVSAAHEGVKTNFLYALDNDNDRTNDFMYGATVTFTTRLDRTPPAQVTNVFATINGVIDDSSQLKLSWTPLTNAGIRAADGDPLSPWKSYVIFYTTDDTDPTTNSPSFSVNNGLADLGTNTTPQIILSNLVFDTFYRFAIAGLDVAGNLGAISAVVTQRTTGLVITQGVVSAARSVTVKWNMKADLPYDVIYQDNTSWGDTLTNNWRLMASVTNLFPEDTGTSARTPPFDLGTTTMRFYRVSGSGRWATNSLGINRTATREIYVVKNVNLVPGDNWISLFCEPTVNTIAAVLGTNLLPSATLFADATKVSWYSAANSSVATAEVWLAASGNWHYSVGGTGIADDKPLPLHEGFTIKIPGASARQLVIAGLVTTNVRTYAVGPGGAAAGSEIYNLRSLDIPRRTTLAESGLKGALTAVPNRLAGPDELRVLDNSSGLGSKVVPRLRAWLRSPDNTFRHFDSSNTSAENDVIEPGDMLLIVRRNSGTTTVTNALHYTPPGRNMNP